MADFRLFLQNGKRKEGVKADGSDICNILKNKMIPRQSKNCHLVLRCSISLFETYSF